MQTIDPERADFDGDRLARIGPAMAGYVARGQLAGVTTLATRNGEVVHFRFNV